VRFEALRIRQPNGHYVYSFAVLPQILLRIATVPHMKRNADGTISGYQRPEIRSHVRNMARDFDSRSGLMPTSIFICFDARVTFWPSVLLSDAVDVDCEEGILEIPDQEGETFAEILDGQQRLAALTISKYEHFPIFATAVITDDEAFKKALFRRANNSRPLQTQQKNELVEELEGDFGPEVAQERLISRIVRQLNFHPVSSLRGQIKMYSWPEGYMDASSIRSVIRNSISDGALSDVLYEERSPQALEDRVVSVISEYWNALAMVFPDAVHKKPNASRLTHGVGVKAMGFIMDQLYLTRPPSQPWTAETIAESLRPLAPHCAWTAGRWTLSKDDIRPWNGLQNTDKEVRILTKHLRQRLRRE